MRIAICDDESLHQQQLVAIFTEIQKNQCTYFEIDVYDNAQDLVEILKYNKNRFDLIMLDILMDTMSGMEAAHEMRRLNISTPIVFLTSSKEFAIESYEVDAFSYILKPIQKEKIITILEKYNNQIHMREDCLAISTRYETLKLPVKNIYYIESKKRKLIIYLEQKELELYGKLTEFKEDLDSSLFIRCHQSFIVNLAFINRIAKDYVLLDNDVTIPISRVHKKKVHESFITYISKVI